MNSVETNEPSCSSWTQCDDYDTRIDEDSRDGEEATFADVAGVVANLNEKICLLRREILELKDSGGISVTGTLLNERNSPLGLPPEDKSTVRSLGRNFIRKITAASYFEKKLWKNECKRATNCSNSFVPCHRDPKTSNDKNSPIIFETRCGNRRVCVVGAQNRSRTTCSCKSGKKFQSKSQLPVKCSGGCGKNIRNKSKPVPRCGEKAIATEPTRIDERWKTNRGNRFQCDSNGDTRTSNETINSTSENCVFDEILCVKKSDNKGSRLRGWNESPEKSDKCPSIKCYGRRVRKRISRGVQTLPPRKKRSYHVKRRMGNLFKFKWRCSEDCQSRKQKTFETWTEEKSVEVIYKPAGENPRRKDHTLDRNKNADKNTREKSIRTSGNEIAKKNDNRKYDFSVDGTNIEITRTEKINTKEQSSKQPKLSENRMNSGRKRRGKIKLNEGKNIDGNDKNSLLSDGGSSGQSEDRKSLKSRIRETVKNKIDAKTKTGRIKERKQFKKTNPSTEMKNEDKDASPADGNSDKPAEKPEIKETRTVDSKETKISSKFKWFTKKEENKSAAPRPPPKNVSLQSHEKKANVSGSKSNGKELDARRNDIADVKKRLDVCIADLNDIILNLSKVFEQVPTPGGPAGEGQPQEIKNFFRRGRSRLR